MSLDACGARAFVPTNRVSSQSIAAIKGAHFSRRILALVLPVDISNRTTAAEILGSFQNLPTEQSRVKIRSRLSVSYSGCVAGL
jgi:hypothetical protein